MSTYAKRLPKAMTREERLSVVHAFAAGVRIAGKADVYWLPSARRIAVRSIVAKRGRDLVSVPDEAIFIGRFTHGSVRASEFANDLDDFLAQPTEAAAPVVKLGRRTAQFRRTGP